MDRAEYMELLRVYWERFGEKFPTEAAGSREEIAARIAECLESGEPYEPPEGVWL